MFFDFYVIPLAKKLVNCGYFGSAADDYLAYAQLNRYVIHLSHQTSCARRLYGLSTIIFNILNHRKEWDQEGERIVGEYKEKYFAAFPEHRCD